MVKAGRMDRPIQYKITIASHNKTIMADENDSLADKIQEAGIALSAYCNKKGLCGKCFVEIKEANLPPLNEKEEFFIEQKGLELDSRIACLYKIRSDLTIRIPEESIMKETLVLQTGIKSSIPLNPAVKKYDLKLKRPKIGLPYSSLELLERCLRIRRLTIPLPLLKALPGILERSRSHITAAVYNDREILDIGPKDTVSKNFGIAVDIGTTTVVVELVDLNTGESVDSAMANNSQMKYGSDVVSRISYAFQNKKNLAQLKNSILETVNGMIDQILDRNEVSHSNIYEIVIAGNTPMNHFLMGIPVKSLAVSPFHSVFTCLPELSSRDLGFRINRNGKAYIVPNIKSFVGGDISAGLAASDLDRREGNYLYIDLGTNGEIVLKAKDKFIATSTAAGPAFEGMNISCGMLALPGAIYKADVRDDVILHTIKNKPAKGICGTGLIDLISIFLENDMINPNGKIMDNARKIRITDDISITQKDVREMQLAIAAIKSGIRMLLLKNRLKIQQLDGIFIAGAFGNYLNIENTMKMGLLPQIDERKVIFIGNASLAGAKALLLSSRARKEIEALVKKIRFISLAADPLFQGYFIRALEFRDVSFFD